MSTSKRKKILLIGDPYGNQDEGMKIATSSYLKYLQKYYQEQLEVACVNAKEALQFWKRRPAYIHFCHGPSIKTFVLGMMLKVLYPRARQGYSFIHPSIESNSTGLLKLLGRFDAFGPSEKYLDLLAQTKANCIDLPLGGVALDKFTLSSSAESLELKKQLQVDGKPVILHCGHLKKSRNLQALLALVDEFSVVLIVSTSTPPDFELKAELERGGVRVIHEFIPNIADYYNAADVYLFPVLSEHDAIALPLSVLEAMACGRPVVSTPFGLLKKYIPEGTGISFTENLSSSNLKSLYAELKDDSCEEIRERITHLSWNRIVTQLADVYLK